MGYLPKSIVEKGIKERVRKDRFGKEHTDYEAYFGTDPFTKKAVRITRADRDELIKDIKDFYLRYQSGGDAAVRLTAQQSLDAKNAIETLAEAKVSISLTEAVKAFLSGSACVQGVSTTITVGAAYDEYLKTNQTSNANIRKIVSTVGKWAEDYGKDKMLAGITSKVILEYLQANYTSRMVVNKKTGKKQLVDFAPKTYNSNLKYLNTFFNWCAREERQYISKNPIRTLEYRAEPWVEPRYMKPDEVERLMRLIESHKEDRPDMLAYEIVNLFCGSRDIEVLRMADENSANKVNLEDETIRIANGKGFQTGRRPRAFHICDTALAWMRSFDFMAAIKTVTGKTRDDIYKLAKKNDINVFHNFGRHTFITMHVAAFGDPAKTQAMVGTSEKMRADNYCGLASKADGEAFFRIMPK